MAPSIQFFPIVRQRIVGHRLSQPCSKPDDVVRTIALLIEESILPRRALADFRQHCWKTATVLTKGLYLCDQAVGITNVAPPDDFWRTKYFAVKNNTCHRRDNSEGHDPFRYPRHVSDIIARIIASCLVTSVYDIVGSSQEIFDKGSPVEAGAVLTPPRPLPPSKYERIEERFFLRFVRLLEKPSCMLNDPSSHVKSESLSMATVQVPPTMYSAW